MLRTIWLKLRSLWQRPVVKREIDEELRFHLEQRTAENISNGMSPEEAAREARKRFGNLQTVREECRDSKGASFGETTWQDLRFGLRMLWKNPGFATTAVLTLALGIGANTALFSLVDDVLLKSLPVRKPDELILLRWLSPRNGGLIRSSRGTMTDDPATGLQSSTPVSYFIFDRLRADAGQKEMFGDFFAFASLRQLNLNIDHQAELAQGQVVTGSYFAGLGVPAMRGRTLGFDDDREGAPPAAMISHQFWQRRFGGDPAVIGKTIRANNVAVTIVGITPPEFRGTLQLGEIPDLTLPLMLEPQLDAGRPVLNDPLMWWLHVAGRLKPGVTSAQAQARLEPIFVQAARDAWLERQAAQRLASLDTRVNPLLRLTPGGQGLVENRRTYERPLRILMCIVGAVLLIACANVANLLLARAVARTREIAVRLSLGASRWRLIRQLLTESVLLALLGGAAGVLVAQWGRAALLSLRPIPVGEPLAIDWRVLGFTVGVSVLTGVLFGLAPAWRATRADLNSAMKEKSGAAAGRSRVPLRSVLMVVQVALSVVLLVGAGLFVRTLSNIRHVDAGFKRENLLLFTLDLGVNGYSRLQSTALLDRVVERVGQLPGVRAAAFSRVPFLRGGSSSKDISVEGRELPAIADSDVFVNAVHPAFFETMGLPLVLGRNLSLHDGDGAPGVAVVSQKFAEKIFPGENPIGRCFAVGNDPANHPLEIVGVARDVHFSDLRTEIPLTIYTSFYQEAASQTGPAARTAGSMTFAVRTSVAPLTLAPAIRQAVQAIDPELPVINFHTQEEQVAELVSSERLFAMLTAFFGIVALLLTCIGLYGLLAHSVATRTREIGIRMALGATRAKVAWPILCEALLLAAVGLSVGVPAALTLARLIASQLYGVAPTDPVTLIGCSILLIAVTLVSAWIPSRRAARVDPIVALRCE